MKMNTSDRQRFGDISPYVKQQYKHLYNREEFTGVPPVTVSDGDFTPYLIEQQIRSTYGIKTREELYEGAQLGQVKAQQTLNSLQRLLDDRDLTQKQQRQMRRCESLENLAVEFRLYLRRTRQPFLRWLLFSSRGRAIAAVVLLLSIFAGILYGHNSSNTNQPASRGVSQEVGTPGTGTPN